MHEFIHYSFIGFIIHLLIVTVFKFSILASYIHVPENKSQHSEVTIKSWMKQGSKEKKRGKRQTKLLKGTKGQIVNVAVILLAALALYTMKGMK